VTGEVRSATAASGVPGTVVPGTAVPGTVVPGTSASGTSASATPVAAQTTGNSGTLVAIGEFGPYDALAERAHDRYIDGFSDEAVRMCQTWLTLTRAAGDAITSRYLRYIAAITLQDLGRNAEALAEVATLTAELGDAAEPVWRAKALSVVAESSTRLGEHGRAIAAMAEADWLIGSIPVGSYGHLSATIGVALSMRSLNLLEQADVLMQASQGAGSPEVNVLVAMESGLLAAYWGTALLVIDRTREAAAHFAIAAQRAIRTQRMAAAEGLEQKVARAEVLEAYAIMRLGDLELAAARARAAAERFSARLELVETYLLHLVLGEAAAAEGRLDDARASLAAVERSATTAGREVWSVAAMSALADVHAQQSGPHEGMDLWRSVARTALARSWSEREGRFAALRDRNHLRELADRTDRMGRAVVEDPLTGLGNRRMLEVSPQTEADVSTVVFIDVDDFKQVNDTYSHAVGDKVLREVAGILRHVAREDDNLIRFGGDEFIILSTGSLEGATVLAHRVHETVRGHAWGRIAPGLSVTVSVGVGPVTGTVAASMVAADGALMAAKRGGRDRVVVQAAA
jgi:diguanylate cyclase (GGDEF)-like protein